jgi:8-oxo-dGTP pyrophosphatase MutT (NUDIX family)
MNDRLPQLLAERLSRPLPGPMVGSRFESRPRTRWHHDRPSADARPAAVLILLYPHRQLWHLPLTVRPRHLAAHAGQISLPGGAVEAGESSHEAAIREFHEELDAAEASIEVVGSLSPLYVGTSNFLVTPWVAFAAERPAMVPNPAEVALLLEVPLRHLLDPANLESSREMRDGTACSVPHFTWQSHRIWGATCLILGELVTLLEAVPA